MATLHLRLAVAAVLHRRLAAVTMLLHHLLAAILPVMPHHLSVAEAVLFRLSPAAWQQVSVVLQLKLAISLLPLLDLALGVPWVLVHLNLPLMQMQMAPSSLF